MDAAERLRDLVERHASELPDLAWVSEADRWAEFVFCLLYSSNVVATEQLREIVGLLHACGALAIDILGSEGEDGNQAESIIGFVLRRYYVDPDIANSSAQTVRRTAVAIRRAYGRPQKLLRRYAEALREDLIDVLRENGLAEPQLRYAVSHWLQNAASLPVSVDDPAVVAFRTECGLDSDGLEELVDSMEINLAALDDLLRLDAAANSSDMTAEDTEPDGTAFQP